MKVVVVKEEVKKKPIDGGKKKKQRCKRKRSERDGMQPPTLANTHIHTLTKNNNNEMKTVQKKKKSPHLPFFSLHCFFFFNSKIFKSLHFHRWFT